MLTLNNNWAFVSVSHFLDRRLGLSQVAIPSAGDLLANITQFKEGMKLVIA